MRAAVWLRTSCHVDQKRSNGLTTKDSQIGRSRFSRGERQSHIVTYDYLLLAILALIWGASFMLQKVAVQEVQPVTMTAWRQIIAALVFVGVLAMARIDVRLSLRDHVLLLLSAILGTALPFSLISIGVTQIDSGLAAILMGAMPLLTILLAHFMTADEPLNTAKLFAVCIGIFGLLVLFWPSLASGVGGNLQAKLLVTLAAFCYSLNSIVTKRILHIEAPVAMGLIVAWSVVILVPASLIIEDQDWSLPGPAVSFAIVALGIFPTALAAFLMYEIIGRQGAGFFSQINLLVPLTGVFTGMIVLGERLDWNAWLALLIILCGVVVSRNWNASRTARPRERP